jgi:hypothetical protein
VAARQDVFNEDQRGHRPHRPVGLCNPRCAACPPADSGERPWWGCLLTGTIKGRNDTIALPNHFRGSITTG